MCLSILHDSRFFEILFQYDWDMAALVQEAGCHCGGVLHTANYPRKPRGGPPDLGSKYDTRLSFCCAREGCRCRATPPSLRFLGRRVYLGAVVVLASAMREGTTAKRAVHLQKLLGVSLRTLKRWRVWWREVFPKSEFWKGSQGYLSPPVDTSTIPASLIERFSDEDERTKLTQILVFLAPLSTKSARAPAGWSMAARNPQRMHLERPERRP